MRCCTVLPLILLAASCAFSQTGAVSYEWKATLKVVGEDGSPVSGANANIGYYDHSQPVDAKGITDTNGIFTFSHVALSTIVQVGLQAEKDGYYFARMGRTLSQNYDPSQWYFTQTLVLKKVGQPIAMYAKWVNENPPILGKPVGYDLAVGDWVAPNRKGINADIIFQKTAYRKSGADYEYKVKVTFPKIGDGFQIYTIPDAEKGSSLRSPHEAPIAGYQPELVKERSAHPGQPAKNDDDPNRIYLFRVRTAIDDRGNVVSAHYGKIYGDFMQFCYYLNPTPNSRDIEFDGKHNLLGGLQSFEQVVEP